MHECVCVHPNEGVQPMHCFILFSEYMPGQCKKKKKNTAKVVREHFKGFLRFSTFWQPLEKVVSAIFRLG